MHKPLMQVLPSGAPEQSCPATRTRPGAFGKSGGFGACARAMPTPAITTVTTKARRTCTQRISKRRLIFAATSRMVGTSLGEIGRRRKRVVGSAMPPKPRAIGQVHFLFGLRTPREADRSYGE